jgi:dipeptidyl aminopeptidase/acylaminoacyl peptidase
VSALRPGFVLMLIASACARPALPGPAAVSPASVAGNRVTVTATEFTKVSHDVSAGGCGIVFDAFGQLWQVPASGGEARPLTKVLEDSAAARDPRFSPDGRSVLYVGDEGLWRLTLASGGRERLPGTPPEAAAWHPGGEEVVGVRWEPAPGGPPREQLVRYELATGALTPMPAAGLPLQEGGRLLTPAWSTDGRHVAVTVIPSLGFVESGSLWEVEVGTGAAQRLLPDGWVGRSPAYSPDGEWLAFVGGESEEQHQVHVLRRADGSLRRLTSAPETEAQSHFRFGRVAWTSGGAGLVYAWQGRLATVALEGGADSLVDAEAKAFTTRTSSAAFGTFAAEGPARNAVLAQARLHRFNLGRLHAAGAVIAAGTDASGMAAAMHDELERLVAVGLSPAEALTAATLTAARVLGAEGEIGQVAPGYRGDLLILDADPLADIRNIRRIHAVIQGGW